MSDVLQFILKGQEAVRKATVQVEWMDDPLRPNLRAYKLVGETREAVQECITSKMRWLEHLDGCGFAQFSNPTKRPDGKWYSEGGVLFDV
jgi:hypothetical protein